jgi:hypothetical protein
MGYLPAYGRPAVMVVHRRAPILLFPDEPQSGLGADRSTNISPCAKEINLPELILL